jgi:hypothetical protein
MLAAPSADSHFQDWSTDAVSVKLLNKFYWHSVGHMLGLDTHDVASMGFDRWVGVGLEKVYAGTSVWWVGGCGAEGLL